MQPPQRPFAPDDRPSDHPNLTPPPVFEPAPSPANSLAPTVAAPFRPANENAPVAPQEQFNPLAPFSTFQPGLQPPPIASPTQAAPNVPFEFFGRIPRWRWFMSLLLVGFYPVFVSLLGKIRPQHGGDKGAALPSSVRGLVLYSLLELGIFGVFWLLGWLFSRATKDELLLRWRGGIKPVLQGFGYALALRLGLVVVIAFVATLFLTITGTDPKHLAQFMQQNQPKTDSLFPPGALSNPLYLIVMVTLLSFVVAGVREEFWRNATMASLRHLFPSHWSDNARWIVAIGLSSVVFGLGHVYQGGLGVVFTSILGAGLGWVTWRHRSIWPSVFAHGFIDATSFLAAAYAATHKVGISAFWMGG